MSEQDPPAPRVPGPWPPQREWPKEITPDLTALLGLPNFQCSPVAHLFVACGWKIPPDAKAEQAFVLHWLLGIWFAHGEAWGEVASVTIREMRRKLELAKAQEKGGGDGTSV
jgi:hypothetical protein